MKQNIAKSSQTNKGRTECGYKPSQREDEPSSLTLRDILMLDWQPKG